MRIKKRWIAVSIISIVISIIFGHRIVTKTVFEHYCKTNVGLFIYEKVDLGEEYFISFPDDKGPGDLDERFIFGENMMLNQQQFEQNYIYDYMKNIKVSFMGPIYSTQTIVTRKSDSKVLGKAVSGVAYVGLFKALGSNKRPRIYCPKGQDEKGFYFFNKGHRSLLYHVFNKK